jgi:DNA gyrase subunit A
MRGVAHTEEVQLGKGRHKRNAVVVTELPYQLSKAGWIEKLAESVNDGKIGGIADIRDESDRDGMRVVVELRRDAEPDKVLKDLQRRTALQSNFGAILLALVNGQPQQLSLRQLLQTFLDYRELTLIRRTSHALRKTEDRLEVVEGLITALNNLQAVIAMIQEAKDAASARASLMVRLDLNERQADAVLAMPLRRLTGLEQESLRQEVDNLREERERLKLLLENRDQLLDAMVGELKTLKKRFSTPRRTRLVEGGDALIAERAASQRPNTELLRQQALAALPGDGRLLIQADGQVKIVTPQVLGRLHFGDPCPLSDAPSPAQRDPSNRTAAATSRHQCQWSCCPGALGICWTTTWCLGTIPSQWVGRGPDRGARPPTNAESSDLSLGLLSSDGRFKRLPLAEVLDLSGRATSVVKLKDGVQLKAAVICREHHDLILVSDIGRMLRLPINEDVLPLMGRLAQGPMTMRLLPGEQLIGALCPLEPTVLLVSGQGQFARIDLTSIRSSQRGDLGSMAIQITGDTDRITGITETNGLIGIVSTEQRHGRIDPTTLEITNPGDAFSNQIELHQGEAITVLVPQISS